MSSTMDENHKIIILEQLICCGVSGPLGVMSQEQLLQERWTSLAVRNVPVPICEH